MGAAWKRLRAYLPGFALLVLLYLLLAGSTSVPEIVAGCAVSLAASISVELVRRTGGSHLDFDWRWIGRLLKTPLKIARDTWTVSAVLVKRLFARRRFPGVHRSVEFDPGKQDDPSDTARRAFVIAALSIAPNSYVVDLHEDEHEMIVHQLVPTDDVPGSEDPKWPI